MKNVHSKDPIKAKLMFLIKDYSGGNRVTLVRQEGEGLYSGSALVVKKGQTAKQLGRFFVKVTVDKSGDTIYSVIGENENDAHADVRLER